MLNVEMKTEGNVLYVTLQGRLDTLTSPELAEKLEPELAGVNGVELDFADLVYLSSAGLRTLLMIQQAMEEKNGSTVIIRNANEVYNFSVDETRERSYNTFVTVCSKCKEDL